MACYKLESSLGYSVTKQNNIDLIEDDKLVFIVGNTIQILNINSNQDNYGKFNDDHIIINGHSDGIGAFAIHPNKQCFAFGEIGHMPDIYIYSYPQLKQQKILQNGTQRKYSDMQFNVNGNYLATIGGSPDHMLTIWDWKVGSVILRAKAFSQDVFSVRFSPFNQNRLITAGTGHIRFWEMAKTFTGLKLQGKIGKFGEVDLSDVWSFVEFPSGKVLSGSEHGNILMWQTDLIQFVVKPDENTTCHQHNIIYVDIYKPKSHHGDDGDDEKEQEMVLISAGSDGYIKFWECDNIEFFEPSDDLPFYPLSLKHEIKVASNCKLMSMIKYKDLYWIIQDAMGNLWKLSMDDQYTLTSVVSFHGLYVSSIECGNKSHDMITTGKDGAIRHWNLETQKCDFMKNLPSSINLSLPWKHTIDDTQDTKFFMAFSDDGVVRIIQKGMDSFLIKYSLRIHDKPIIHAAISNDFKYLATITNEQLFFSEIITSDEDEINIEPIGFVKLQQKLHKIYWSMDTNTLYSYYKKDIIGYKRPNGDQFDTTHSFEIVVEPTITTFTPFLTEEDAKDDEPEPEEVIQEGENEGDKAGDNEKKEEEEEKVIKENIFDSMEWEISCILPCKDNDTDLLISIQCPNNDSFTIPNFYQWNITENEIVKFIPSHFEHDQINNLSYSLSKQFLLISSQQSIIQIRDINDDQHFVNIRIHSSWQKTGNLISMSFDDRMIISSSTDGSLFCHLFDPNKLRHPSFDENFEIDYISIKEAEPEIKSIKHKIDVSDMTENDYSVQGEKIQKELDNAKSAAEKYKAELREELNQIRQKKEDILHKTKEFVKHDLGLSIADLDIDTNLRAKMSQQLDKDKTQIEREMAWNSEKINIGLNKLEDAFLNTVTVENIEVSSFRSNYSVSTFRTPVLPNWVQRDIAKVHQIINAESEKARQIAAKTAQTHDANATTMSSSTFDNAEKTLGSTNNINLDSTNTLTVTQTATNNLTTQMGINKENDGDDTNDISKTVKSPKSRKHKQLTAISASKQKKMVREKLKNALEDLQNEKPDENADDPRDIEAINYAKKNIGDYKLKSDPNYVVPEDEHVNASQKRKQMILLLESINYIKMGLNERVLALRDLKKRIVENITNDTNRLNEINNELVKIHIANQDDDNEEDESIMVEAPTVNLQKEWPQEQRYNYTKQDVIEFERVLQQEAEEKSGTSNAFGGGGGSNHNKSDSKSGGGAMKDGMESSSVSIRSSQSGGRLSKTRKSYQDRLDGVQLSELELSHLNLRKKKLKYEKQVLLDKINSTIHTFDVAVSELREEKYKLMNDLKLTDLKFLTLLKELSVLSNFEDREIELNGKLLKCRTEKAQVVVDLTECQERLSSKLEEIHLWQEKDKKIMKEFDNIVGERNPFYDELKKIFKRKIKRHKRGNNGDGNGDDDSDSDSSYDSSSDGDGGDSDSDGNSDKNEDDSCPKDCDNLIYEKVMELREKRLDQEEILIEFEKAVDELKQQNISLINKEKNIDKNLFATEKEIELFQTEKQQFLNKIIITVPLLLSQIRINLKKDGSNDGDYRLPPTIDNLLIFELKSLDNLQNRIMQQKNEKIEIKKDYTELKKLHKSLTKKINLKQSNIDVEKRKCEQVQFLKYGRLVSLEVLDLNNNVNPETLQLKQKLEKMQKEYRKKYNLWDTKVSDAKEQVSSVIRENTRNISILTSLKTKQNDLMEELDKILEIDVIKDSAPSDQKRNRELQKLVEVAKTQANEIDVLKAEIHMLQRKGGMLYAVPES